MTPATPSEQLAILAWLAALPADRQPRTGAEAVALARHYLLMIRAGVSDVAIVGGAR